MLLCLGETASIPSAVVGSEATLAFGGCCIIFAGKLNAYLLAVVVLLLMP